MYFGIKSQEFYLNTSFTWLSKQFSAWPFACTCTKTIWAEHNFLTLYHAHVLYIPFTVSFLGKLVHLAGVDAAAADGGGGRSIFFFFSYFITTDTFHKRNFSMMKIKTKCLSWHRFIFIITFQKLPSDFKATPSTENNWNLFNLFSVLMNKFC